MQSLRSRWLGALQTNFSRKSKVSRSRSPTPNSNSSFGLTECSPGCSRRLSLGPCQRSGTSRPVFGHQLSIAHLKPSCHLPPSVPVSLISVYRISSTQARNLEIILDPNQSPVILAPLAHPTSLSGFSYLQVPCPTWANPPLGVWVASFRGRD